MFTHADGVTAREEGGARGCARRHRVVPVQDDAVVSQRVDVRRRDLVRAVEAKVVPALMHPLRPVSCVNFSGLW